MAGGAGEKRKLSNLQTGCFLKGPRGRMLIHPRQNFCCTAASLIYIFSLSDLWCSCKEVLDEDVWSAKTDVVILLFFLNVIDCLSSLPFSSACSCLVAVTFAFSLGNHSMLTGSHYFWCTVQVHHLSRISRDWFLMPRGDLHYIFRLKKKSLEEIWDLVLNGLCALHYFYHCLGPFTCTLDSDVY